MEGWQGNEGGASGPRVKGVTIEKCVAFGTEAWWMGKRSTDQQSHRWSCYIRSASPGDDDGPPGNEDHLASYVKKVVFRLHPSFANPTRVVTRAPFMITEMGWGEFEIALRVYFIDPDEECIDLHTKLTLFPAQEEQMSTKKPVLNEARDEIMFSDPSLAFYRCLLKGPISHPARTDFTSSEEDELQRIQRAHAHVQEQLTIMEAKVKAAGK